MRLAVLFLLVAACVGQPCKLFCTSDLDCPSGAFCADQQACLPYCGGMAVCNNACADTFHNCTGCGLPCADGQVCTGTLTCASACEPSRTNCSGSCYDLQNDRANCGTCGHACQQRNEICVKGVCTALQSCG